MNKLIGKTFLYSIGTAASKLISAIIIPIYAFFVTSEALGLYDFALTAAGIAAPICYLAIWEAVLRFTLTGGAEQKAGMQQTVARFTLVVTAALAAAMILTGILFPEVTGILLCCGFMSVSSALAQTWQYFARSNQETRLFVLSGVISSLVNLGTLALLVCFAHMQFVGLGCSYVIAQVSIFVLVESRLRLLPEAIGRKCDRSILRKALAFSVPLIFNLVVSLLLAGFGRLLIVAVLGAEENGNYVFAMKFGNVIAALGSAFSMAAIEEAILRINSKGLGSYFSDLIDGLWKLLLPACIAALPVIKGFYFFLSDSDYAASFPMVPLFLLYAVFGIMSTNYGNAFQVTLKTKYAAFTTLAGLIVAFILSIALIGPMGEFGVSVGLTVGMGVVMAVRWGAAKRMIPFSTSRWPSLFLLVYLVEAAVLCLNVASSPAFVAASALLTAVPFGYLASRGFKKLQSIRDAEEER